MAPNKTNSSLEKERELARNFDRNEPHRETMVYYERKNIETQYCRTITQLKEGIRRAEKSLDMNKDLLASFVDGNWTKRVSQVIDHQGEIQILINWEVTTLIMFKNEKINKLGFKHNKMLFCRGRNKLSEHRIPVQQVLFVFFLYLCIMFSLPLKSDMFM